MEQPASPGNLQAIPRWTLTDLLGLFLSTVGIPPQEATKRNFFLPLTAMYSCLWVQGTDKFFLGASLGGYTFKDNLVWSWPLPVKRGRCQLVGGEPVTLSGWSFSRRPAEHQVIGNCAETYPIVHLLPGVDENNSNVHGLVLQKKALKATVYEDTLSGRFWTGVANPCEDCEFLINLHGVDIQNFSLFFLGLLERQPRQLMIRDGVLIKEGE